MTSKPYYQEYVFHCLRYFARHIYSDEVDEVSKLNYKACESVLNTLKDVDREIIVFLFKSKDTMSDNIYQASLTYSESQEHIRGLLKYVTKAVARERKLAP